MRKKIITNHKTQKDKIIKQKGDDIIKYIGIKQDITTYKLANASMVMNIKYQTTLIEDIFSNNLDNINMHAYNYARTSLVGLLEFAKNHQPILLTK